MDPNIPSWKQRYENTKDIACSFRNPVHIRDDAIRQVTLGWQEAKSQLEEAHSRIAELEGLRQLDQQRQQEQQEQKHKDPQLQQHEDGNSMWLREGNTPAGVACLIGGSIMQHELPCRLDSIRSHDECEDNFWRNSIPTPQYFVVGICTG